MDLTTALAKLRNGYCLWIGAGVGVHIGGKAVPGWPALVQSLESSAKLAAHPADMTHPERIERCLAELRRLSFQRHLRTAIVQPLSAAIASMADSHADASDVVPRSVRQLAHLGALANPIVNFNIEQTTSHLVADAMGFAAVKSFRVSVPGATTLGNYQIPPQEDAFERHVYHPHGSVDDTGICILAQSEYRAMNGTLALQLAAHAAFGSNLAIVGMSLDDRYLREQLETLSFAN